VQGNKLWTPWIIKWAHAESMFTLYPAFPSNLSLSISHRDKGSNFAKNRGADSSLLVTIPPEGKDPSTPLVGRALPCTAADAEEGPVLPFSVLLPPRASWTS